MPVESLRTVNTADLDREQVLKRLGIVDLIPEHDFVKNPVRQFSTIIEAAEQRRMDFITIATLIRDPNKWELAAGYSRDFEGGAFNIAIGDKFEYGGVDVELSYEKKHNGAKITDKVNVKAPYVGRWKISRGYEDFILRINNINRVIINEFVFDIEDSRLERLREDNGQSVETIFEFEEKYHQNSIRQTVKTSQDKSNIDDIIHEIEISDGGRFIFVSNRSYNEDKSLAKAIVVYQMGDNGIGSLKGPKLEAHGDVLVNEGNDQISSNITLFKGDKFDSLVGKVNRFPSTVNSTDIYHNIVQGKAAISLPR